MKAWLVYDAEGAARNFDYIRMHQEIGVSYQMTFQLVLAEDIWQMAGPEGSARPDFALCADNTAFPVKETGGLGDSGL